MTKKNINACYNNTTNYPLFVNQNSCCSNAPNSTLFANLYQNNHTDSVNNAALFKLFFPDHHFHGEIKGAVSHEQVLKTLFTFKKD